MRAHRVTKTEEFRIRVIEGIQVLGDIRGKLLFKGKYALLARITLSRGTKTPPHRHAHESFIYLLKGRVRTRVEDKTYTLTSDESIFHPPGVIHSVEALTDSTWLEVKAPPQEPWRPKRPKNLLREQAPGLAPKSKFKY